MLWIVISFLVFWSICLSTSFIHWKNGLLQILVREVSAFVCGTPVLVFLSSPLISIFLPPHLFQHYQVLVIFVFAGSSNPKVIVLVLNWNHFEMRLFNLRINFYLLRTFPPHLGSFCVVSSFTTFRPHFTSDLLRIGMLSLVTVSPVITDFHSCCLSHHVFDQVNLWPTWVGFETTIFWQCSPGTVETQRLYPLRHGPRRAIKDGFFGLINPYLLPESGPYRMFCTCLLIGIILRWDF